MYLKYKICYKYDPPNLEGRSTEIQEIIDNDDLKVEIIVKNGGEQIKAIIERENDLGYICVEETGEEEQTNRGTIHYSQTGAHLVPARRRWL